MKQIIIYIMGFVLTACTYDPPTQPDEWYENPVAYSDESNSHPRKDEFQNYLDKAVAEGLPGAVLLIRTPVEGTWVGTAGYADIAGNVKWKPSTLCRIGSVTKMFAGTVILKICTEYGIDPDTEVKNFLPAEVVSKIKNVKSATIRQLLNHTSGIYNYLGSPSMLMEGYGSYNYKYQSKEELVKYAYDKDAAFSTGTSWGYSNTNYLLLEMIAEKITGKNSRVLMDSLIFRPLHLKSTGYNPGGKLPEGLARGYGDIFADGRLIDVTETELENFHYDGGIVSTVYDMADYIDALFQSDFLSDTERAELVQTADAKGQSERGTDYYGSGIILEKHPAYGNIWGHSGTAIGYSAHLYYIENEGITIAAIVNGSQNTIEDRSYKWFSPLRYDHILELAVENNPG